MFAVVVVFVVVVVVIFAAVVVVFALLLLFYAWVWKESAPSIELNRLKRIHCSWMNR